MIPGELQTARGDIVLNAGAAQITLLIANTGDRPIQIGSHYHFFEANAALDFDRPAARGMRLDIPAGTAVRFEPGVVQHVSLVPPSGSREVHGLRGLANGATDGPPDPAALALFDAAGGAE